jgi:hypothetical protein
MYRQLAFHLLFVCCYAMDELSSTSQERLFFGGKPQIPSPTGEIYSEFPGGWNNNPDGYLYRSKILEENFTATSETGAMRSPVPSSHLEGNPQVSLTSFKRKESENINDFVGGMRTGNSITRLDLGQTSRQSSKRRASHMENSQADFRVLDMLAPSDFQATPKEIKLMGVHMRPHVEQDERKNGQIALYKEYSSNAFSGPELLYGSAGSMFDPFNHGIITTQQNFDSHPSPTIPKASPLKILSNELTEVKNSAPPQGKRQEEKIFKFDREVFIDCRNSQGDEKKMTNLFNLMKELKVEELIMTEVEFVRYRTNLCPLNRSTTPKTLPKHHNLNSNLQKESINILLTNISIWYEYWWRQINDDFKFFFIKINWVEGSTRVLLLLFLAKSKMINRIVPRKNKIDSLSELEEAYEVWKTFFGTKTSDSEQTEESGYISSIRTNLEKNIKNSSRSTLYAASWDLLEFWMSKNRKEWFNEII